jgi:hypothetical protein
MSLSPVYLCSQRERHVRFAKKSLHELFDYLFQIYGKLTPQTLVDKNQTSMQKPCDPNTPL